MAYNPSRDLAPPFPNVQMSNPAELNTSNALRRSPAFRPSPSSPPRRRPFSRIFPSPPRVTALLGRLPSCAACAGRYTRAKPSTRDNCKRPRCQPPLRFPRRLSSHRWWTSRTQRILPLRPQTRRWLIAPSCLSTSSTTSSARRSSEPSTLVPPRAAFTTRRFTAPSGWMTPSTSFLHALFLQAPGRVLVIEGVDDRTRTAALEVAGQCCTAPACTGLP